MACVVGVFSFYGPVCWRDVQQCPLPQSLDMQSPTIVAHSSDGIYPAVAVLIVVWQLVGVSRGDLVCQCACVLCQRACVSPAECSARCCLCMHLLKGWSSGGLGSYCLN